MTTASERLARQTGSTSAFALVELELELGNGAPSTIVQLASDAELTHGSSYVRTVETEVRTALDGETVYGATVTIRRIVTTAVDSTHAVVLLAAARATRKALDHDPDLAGTLDPSARTVHLRV